MAFATVLEPFGSTGGWSHAGGGIRLYWWHSPH